MSKFAVIDGAITVAAEVLDTICDTEEEALKQAEIQWDRLTEAEQKKRDYFYVCECEVDEDGLIDYDTTKTIKAYK